MIKTAYNNATAAVIIVTFGWSCVQLYRYAQDTCEYIGEKIDERAERIQNEKIATTPSTEK